MNIEDLEEALSDFLPAGFQIETNKHGELVIHTGLRQDDDGELVDIDEDQDEDLDFDPDFEPFEDETEDDDE